MSEHRMWSLRMRDGSLSPWFLGRTRVGVIQDLTGSDGNWRSRWQKWRKDGIRAVRVVVTMREDSPDAD